MKKAILIALMTGLVSFCGCSKKQSTEDVESPSEQAEVQQNQEETVPANHCDTPADAPMTAQDWANANNEFGFNMLRRTTKSTVISPYSAERALGMVYDGACGDTAQEMRKALSLSDAPNLSKAGAEIENAMLANVAADDANEPAEGTMAGPHMPSIYIDNRIWLETTYELKSDYVESVGSSYRAKPTQINFSGDPDGSRKTINDDVAKTTRDKIQDLIKPGMITPLTRLVLTNAVYFKAQWKEKFEEARTAKEKFYGTAGEQDVDMMSHNKKHNVYQDENVTVLEMPFYGDYSLIVMLPNTKDTQDGAQALATFESTVNAVEFSKYLSQMNIKMVDLKMPKFRIEYDASLTDMLKDLGMNTAFTGEANFSRMTDKNDLYISNVVQKAFIDVNENGTEAAAATAVLMKTRAMLREPEFEKIKITVDHPFLYALVENSNHTALFLGRVSEF